jgi:hypothetical protein
MSKAVTVAAAALLAAASAGCGGTSANSDKTILDGGAENVSIGEVRRAIDDLYREHPAIRAYVARDVRYTPTTRDKVVRVCRRGGPQKDSRERESSRIFGCAPLIFFFYRYGRESAVPQAVELARKLYWYAASIKEPYDAQPVLSSLLKTWGVR